MEETKKRGYMAGVGSILFSFMCFIIVLNSGFDIVGQVLTLFSVVFGVLGIGSFLKPETIGDITSRLFENMSRNVQEYTTSTQKQNNSRGSGQAIADRGGQIKQTIIYQEGSKTKSKKKGRASITYV